MHILPCRDVCSVAVALQCISISESTNPGTVAVSVPLSAFSPYLGLQGAGRNAVLLAKIGIAAYLPLVSLLTPASAAAVSSGSVRFALLNDVDPPVTNTSPLDITFSVVGNYIDGIAKSPARKASLVEGGFGTSHRCSFFSCAFVADCAYLLKQNRMVFEACRGFDAVSVDGSRDCTGIT